MFPGIKNSFSNAPWDFHVRKFHINVWVIIVLVSSNSLNSLNGPFNSDGQEDIHKKIAQMYIICARLTSLSVTSRLEDHHLGNYFLSNLRPVVYIKVYLVR